MTTIYHNPRCSKSRETLQLLEKQGEDINITCSADSLTDDNWLNNLLTPRVYWTANTNYRPKQRLTKRHSNLLVENIIESINLTCVAYNSHGEDVSTIEVTVKGTPNTSE